MRRLLLALALIVPGAAWGQQSGPPAYQLIPNQYGSSPSMLADFANRFFAAAINGRSQPLSGGAVIWATGPTSGGTYIDPSSTMRGSVPNDQRLTYDPMTKQRAGLLQEPSIATNYISAPLDFSTNWNGGADTQGKASTDLAAFIPGGTIIKHVRDANPNSNSGAWAVTLPSTLFAYTEAAWMYIPTGSTATAVCVNGSGTGIGTFKACADLNRTNVWQLVSTPFVTTAQGVALTLVTNVTGPSGAVAYSTGYSVTALPYATSFALSTPRAADTAVSSGLGLEQVDGGSGTLVFKGFARGASYIAAAASGGIQLSDGTTNNAITLQVAGDSVNPTLQATVKSAGASTYTQTGGYLPLGQVFTMAISWGAGSFTYADSAGGVGSGTGVIPAGLRLITSLTGPNPISAIEFFPQKMTASALQSLAGTGLAATATLSATPGAAVPANFVGVSFEENDSLQNSQYSGASGTSLAALMNLLGHGVLRIGGNSSDGATWSASAGQVTALGQFMQTIPNWGLIFGLNLCANAPSAQAAVAQNVVAAFPSAILQFGNEPDYYPTSCARAGNNYGPSNYSTEWSTYFSAVRSVAPTAQVAGPDLAATDSWLSAFAASQSANVALFTRHFYPLCAGSSATIPNLLGSDVLFPNVVIPQDIATASSYGLPLRLTETNSVCAGGQSGVSNTLASALWGVEYMAQLATKGVAGVNFHGGRVASMYYTPFVQNGDFSYTPQPIYYAMLMFSQIQGMQMLPVSGQTANLPMFGYLGSDGKKRLLVINKNLTQPASLSIGGSWTTASSLILTGAAPSALTVTLGGASVSSQGGWTPSPTVTNAGGVVAAPPCSAVLITLN